jgi:hypothetical protein
MPGYCTDTVRRYGREVLSEFTDLPLERMCVTATQADGDDAQMDALVAWVQETGRLVHEEPAVRFAAMPAYHASADLYVAENCGFLVVDDFAGRYVYAWPNAAPALRVALPEPDSHAPRM